MKYTVSGFSQLAAVNFNLDSVDLHMLRWIVDFIDSNRMRSMTLDGEKYYWVSYQGLIDDLPILYLKKDAIYKRLKRMCELGILKKKTVFSGGKFSYFTYGENFNELFKSYEELEYEAKMKEEMEVQQMHRDLKQNLLQQGPEEREITHIAIEFYMDIFEIPPQSKHEFSIFYNWLEDIKLLVPKLSNFKPHQIRIIVRWIFNRENRWASIIKSPSLLYKYFPYIAHEASLDKEFISRYDEKYIKWW